MRWVLLAFLVSSALAEGTKPKAKATDYEVNAVSKKGAVGAEYMVHSYGGDRKTFIAKDFLVVEVAVYPPEGQILRTAPIDFALRIDGKKPVLVAQPPPDVVAAMKRVPWWKKGQKGGSGGGLGGVLLGGPLGGSSGPSVQVTNDPNAEEAYESLVYSALPEGEFAKPVSGFVYFPWKGKPSSIKTLELLYEDAILKLR